MDEATLKRILPRASKETVRLNSGASGAELKPALRHEPLATGEGKGKNTGRTLVSITSYRCRLLDPDNLCPKYFIDALRYAGAIPDDREEDIIYQIRQEKTPSKKEEKTLIEIEYQ